MHSLNVITYSQQHCVETRGKATKGIASVYPPPKHRYCLPPLLHANSF